LQARDGVSKRKKEEKRRKEEEEKMRMTCGSI
jgi:hypothetical protein